MNKITRYRELEARFDVLADEGEGSFEEGTNIQNELYELRMVMSPEEKVAAGIEGVE